MKHHELVNLSSNTGFFGFLRSLSMQKKLQCISNIESDICTINMGIGLPYFNLVKKLDPYPQSLVVRVRFKDGGIYIFMYILLQTQLFRCTCKCLICAV